MAVGKRQILLSMAHSESPMNFYFEAGDIVVLKIDRKGLDWYVLVKGFDPIPSGFRVWWADAWRDGRAHPRERIRTYSSQLIRLRRPKEEIRLAARAARWADKKVVAAMLRRTREAQKKEASYRKRGFNLADLPFSIPAGKWLTPEGVRQVLTDLGFKPNTVDKRVAIMERLYRK